MERLNFLARRYNAVVEVAPVVTPAMLTRHRYRPATITVSSSLSPEEQLMVAASLLQTLVLDWPARQVEAPIADPNETHLRWLRLLPERKAFKAAERVARRVLMPDAWMVRQVREQIDPATSAAEVGVPLEAYFLRTMEWREDHGHKPSPNLQQVIEQTGIKTGADLLREQEQAERRANRKKKGGPAVREISPEALAAWEQRKAEGLRLHLRGRGLPVPPDILAKAQGVAVPAPIPPGPYAGLTEADCPLPRSILRQARRPDTYGYLARVSRERAGMFPLPATDEPQPLTWLAHVRAFEASAGRPITPEEITTEYRAWHRDTAAGWAAIAYRVGRS